MKRTSLKAVPDVKPEKMPYEQIDRLARGLAFDLIDDNSAIACLMLLMQEIAEHPFNTSHVETVANLINMHLFAVTPEADRAIREFLAAKRRALLETKGGDAR